MRLTGDRAVAVGHDGGGGGGGGGATVVVGVKFDALSRELLTWALVKVAQPGDRVIALHVLDTVAAGGVIEGTATLLSLVKNFDSVLAVYEGFCNLKQVDLKLKVCRGSSVRKILVREAIANGAAKLIVGASKAHHRIRSSVCVAKYCARKLSKNFGVFAVDNGRIVFQRESTDTNADYSNEKLNLQSRTCSQNSGKDCGRLSGRENCVHCSMESVLPDDSEAQSLEELPQNVEDNSLALVPISSSEAEAAADLGTHAVVVPELPVTKRGWAILRNLLLRKWQHSDKSCGKKMSVVKWVLKLPSRYSSAIVHPDQKQSNSDHDEDHCSNLDGVSGAIVPVGPAVLWSPVSPSRGSNGLPKELQGLHEKFSSSCRLFSYQELLSATSNFMPENMVGKGGSSHVYRGCLPGGKELAVKILKPSEDVLKDFVSEIEIITTLHHKNIISLFGFCFEGNNFLLVYDFLSRGSLEENLHGNKKDWSAFGWQERYKVAVGVAKALDYLHNGCDQPLIHRDVKSSNILLSDDFEPQLSDFGLASWVSPCSSFHMTCTDVAGTFGYLAPEYFMHGKVSDKIDVYAFGVVILELISGRMPINSDCPKGQESLVMWAKPILESGKVAQLLDPHLSSDRDDQIERMVLAATLCIRRSPRFRPQISLVLKLLQGDEEVTKWARQQLCSSEEFDMADGEAFPTSIQSHLNLALLDLEDDSLSVSGNEQSVSLEDYLKGRWSRTSSFD